MTQDQLIQHWKESAEYDHKVMEVFFAREHFVWCLFLGHLVIEKLLKAHYIKRMGKEAPKIHDLNRIADIAGFRSDG